MSRIVAVIANLFLWGLGYLLIGRIIFGIGWLIVLLFTHLPLYYLGLNFVLTIPGILTSIGHVIISILLAYDVYKK